MLVILIRWVQNVNFTSFEKLESDWNHYHVLSSGVTRGGRGVGGCGEGGKVPPETFQREIFGDYSGNNNNNNNRGSK